MLPALPAMGEAFGVTNANDRSLVLTVFLIGLGLPQLIAGPITDRFGRRVPLLFGLALYAACAFAALFAPTFGILLALRFLQGFGSAAVSVASQAAVRDHYSGRAMAEVMSLVFTIFMVVPIVAPFVGQVILLTGPWQYIFVFMGLVGVACLGVDCLRLPESLAVADRRPLSFGSVAEGFATVVGKKTALFYGIAGMFMFGGILGLVNTSQQIYVEHFGVGAYFPVPVRGSADQRGGGILHQFADRRSVRHAPPGARRHERLHRHHRPLAADLPHDRHPALAVPDLRVADGAEPGHRVGQRRAH